MLIDTGVFVAAADTDEPRHRDCAAILDTNWGRIGTTGPVVAEAAIVDSSLVTIAERLGLRTLATLNTRDFHVPSQAHQRIRAGPHPEQLNRHPAVASDGPRHGP